ncbi:MAG TPA: TetR/AcrR family transcriptional regulator [Rectinemataceae bacterium]|nr:TetR/AcrR family transcriptional regulator [Rectinemataceae bacterium]
MSSEEPVGNARGARERILAAATDLAGREGLEALTTRRVAQEAGVNVGLLHYYFESKEALVEETLAGFLSEMLSIAESGVGPAFTAAEGKNDGGEALTEEELIELLGRAVEFASKRPGLIFGLIEKLVETVGKIAGRATPQEGPLVLPKDSPLGILAMVETILFKRIRPLLVESLGDDPELLGRRALQLVTSIFHPMLFTPYPAAIFGVDLGSDGRKRDYVRMVVRDALNPPSSSPKSR